MATLEPSFLPAPSAVQYKYNKVHLQYRDCERDGTPGHIVHWIRWIGLVGLWEISVRSLSFRSSSYCSPVEAEERARDEMESELEHFQY